MDVVREAEASLSAAEAFISRLPSLSTDEASRKLVEVRPLLKSMHGFYRAFLEHRYGITVRSFSYRDKRTVSRRLVREEDSQSAGRGTPKDAAPALLLASAFEDLSDLLHGDLEFGYSDEPDDYRQFHLEAFPRWLRLLGSWLQSTDQADLAERAGSIEQRYVDAFESFH